MTINGKSNKVDGIDVLKRLLEMNPNLMYRMVTGCSLGSKSSDSVKYHKLIGNSLSDFLVPKSGDMVNLKMQIFRHLS